MATALTALLTPIVAHGLAVQVEDLPLPLSSFYYGAAAALALSFVLLAFGLRTPKLDRAGAGRPAPRWIARLARARAMHVCASALALCWLFAVVATALWGSTEAPANPSPNLVFVLGWIGIPLAAMLLGIGVLALHPVAALARLGRMREHTTTPPPARLGVWAAWAGLAVFVWLELVYPTSTRPALVGGLVVGWVVLGLAAASWCGIHAYVRHIDPFGTYARLLASLAPWSTRDDGTLGIRWPLIGSNRDVRSEPGLVALVTLLIGSVSYDGLTRTGWWQERVALATADLSARGIPAESGRIVFGTFGLIALVLVAWALFEAAAWLSARVGSLEVGGGASRAAQQFAPSLLPIALAYVVAHYFSFFTVQVQDLIRLASDPFDSGANWFGAADRTARDLRRPDGTLVWVVQVASIVIGHVAGLLLAHDRALALSPKRADGTPDLRRATLSQLPMLALMLLYTVGGLYFLSEGLS